MLEDPQAGRQFAPEYSQDSYLEMLSKDYAIGNYVRRLGHERFTNEDRERLINIIQELNRKKEYKVETLHLAGSIADRYLKIVLSSNDQPIPNLFALAATCMLMAAKLEQPISPSFNRMVALLPSHTQKRVTKQDLIKLEEKTDGTNKWTRIHKQRERDEDIRHGGLMLMMVRFALST